MKTGRYLDPIFSHECNHVDIAKTWKSESQGCGHCIKDYHLIYEIEVYKIITFQGFLSQESQRLWSNITRPSNFNVDTLSRLFWTQIVQYFVVWPCTDLKTFACKRIFYTNNLETTWNRPHGFSGCRMIGRTNEIQPEVRLILTLNYDLCKARAISYFICKIITHIRF